MRKFPPLLSLSYLLTSVEVDERLQSNLSSNIVLGLGLSQLLGEVVVRGHVGVVVVLVVKLHDLAGDGRLKRAIVIYDSRDVSGMLAWVN